MVKVIQSLRSLIFSVVIVLCQQGLATPVRAMVVNCKNLASLELTRQSLQAKFSTFVEGYWEYLMQENPEWATYVGYNNDNVNSKWSDLSKSSIETQAKDHICQKEFLEKFKSVELSDEDRLNLEILQYNLGQQVVSDTLPGRYIPMTQMGGLQTEIPDLMTAAPQNRAEDYEDRIRRLEALPVLVQQTQDLMKEGIAKGVMPPKLVVEKVIPQMEALLEKDLKKNPILKSFYEIPETIGAKDKKKLIAEAEEVFVKKSLPSLQKLSDFIKNEYAAKATSSIGLSALPEGKRWYEHLIRQHTTTEMSAQQIHELGLREVKRIAKEMNKLKVQSGFKGSLAEFNKFLQTDSQFFYDKPEDLITGYREIAKRIDPELPRLFSLLPRLPYGVREMPAYKAPESPTAFYMSGSLKSGRAGYFEANTFDLKSRPKWEMEVLTAHEAVPGHHLQISLAQEVESLPEFRKEMGYNAFSEGWALYSESLGDQLSLYKNTYSKYGQLSYDMWRAVRLVVDTGIHAKGWSDKMALKYAMAQMPKPEAQMATEIDRYIAYPGQALSYKIGQLKFMEIKEKTQKRLGKKFDIREFHTEVLRHGALPMETLEKQVSRWQGAPNPTLN